MTQTISVCCLFEELCWVFYTSAKIQKFLPWDGEQGQDQTDTFVSDARPGLSAQT